jgi:hypothetical protein
LLLHKLSAPVFKLSDFFLNARDFFGFGLCHGSIAPFMFGMDWMG